MGSLLCSGTDFVAAMTKLVTDVKAVPTNLNGHPKDTAAENKLCAAVRTALAAEEGVRRGNLTTLGMSAPTSATQLVFGTEGGEVLPNAAELETLTNMDSSIGGHAIVDKFHPTKRMIVFFIRGVKQNPPTLYWFNLDYAVTAFDQAQRPRHSTNAIVELARTRSDYDDIDPIAHNRKIALVHAIMLVMHALTIACSFVISAADRGKYCGTTAYNTVKIAGVDTLVYGTRYMISLVLAEIMEYGDSLSVQEMRAAFRETFRLAAIHVKEGYRGVPNTRSVQ